MALYLGTAGAVQDARAWPSTGFRPPFGLGRVTFLCVAKEKSPKERPPPPIRWLRQSPRARANVGRAAADGTLAYAIHGFGLGDPSELRGREHAEPQRNQPAEQGVSPVRRGRRQVADDGVCQIGSALIYSVFLCNQPGFGRVGFYLRKHWTNFHRVAGPISSSPCDKE